MGMDTGAYKSIEFDEVEGLIYKDDYDKLNARTKKFLKYPNSELYKIAEKFFEVSKGDIDFRNYIMYDGTFDFSDDDVRYINECKKFHEELKMFDFNSIIKILTNAIDYYHEYSLDFKPDIYRNETDLEIVEYLLDLAKERYYILYDY